MSSCFIAYYIALCIRQPQLLLQQYLLTDVTGATNVLMFMSDVGRVGLLMSYVGSQHVSEVWEEDHDLPIFCC